MDTPTIPQRPNFPVSMVVDLWIRRRRGDNSDTEKLRGNIIRRIYRRIETGDIRATRLGLGEPLMIERDEVDRIIKGDVE